MTKHAILFDMDGTLVDSEGIQGKALVDAVSHFGYRMDTALTQAITGTCDQDTHAFLQRELDFEPDFRAYVEARYRRYLENAAGLVFRPGAEAALEGLKRLNIPFAVVSNSDRILVDVNLKTVGLQVPGLISVSRNDVLQGKPHPEPYLRAAYLLGVKPENCIVVEDSAPGAMAGSAAGMTVIGWPEPHRKDMRFPDEAILADPSDLWATLSTLLSDVQPLSDLS